MQIYVMKICNCSNAATIINFHASRFKLKTETMNIVLINTTEK